MTKIIYTILIVILSMQSLSAQQEPDFSLYNSNMTLWNPAYAGVEESNGLTLAYRRQWLGIPGAPRSISATFSTPLGKQIGMAINVYNNEYFVTKRRTITSDISYRVQVGDTTQVYFGLKVGGSFLNNDLTEVETPVSDPAFNQDISEFNMHMGFGLYVLNPNYYISISTPNVIKEKYENQPNAITEGANFYFRTGYHFKLKEKLTLTPMAMMRLLADFENTYDIGASLDFNKNVIFGLNYRIDTMITPYGLLKIIDDLKLGFSYDIITSELRSANTDGSLDFILKYSF